MSNEFVENGLVDTEGLVTEELPSLSDFAEEPGGALPRGWYAAEIIEGYSTRKGTQFVTEDSIAKNGDSHNLRLCFKLSPIKGDPRNLQQSLNYRSTDFTPERLAFIKEMREQFKGVRGRWSDSDAQRSSLAVATLGQIEKALGFRLKLVNGAINPGPFIGQHVDVRLNIDDQGYNNITAYAPAGTYAPKPKA